MGFFVKEAPPLVPALPADCDDVPQRPAQNRRHSDLKNRQKKKGECTPPLFSSPHGNFLQRKAGGAPWSLPVIASPGKGVAPGTASGDMHPRAHSAKNSVGPCFPRCLSRFSILPKKSAAFFACTLNFGVLCRVFAYLFHILRTLSNLERFLSASCGFSALPQEYSRQKQLSFPKKHLQCVHNLLI